MVVVAVGVGVVVVVAVAVGVAVVVAVAVGVAVGVVVAVVVAVGVAVVMHRHSRKLSDARGLLGGIFLDEPDPGVRAALTRARDEIDQAAKLLAELSPRISEEERRRRLEEWGRNGD